MNDDIIGKMFGDWKVLYIDENNSEGKNRRYFCECSCGKIKSVRYASLKKGDSKGCGCFWIKNSKIQVGDTIGEWEVVRRGESRNSHRLWLCKCSCGKESWIESTELNSGSTKSCGHGKFKIKTEIYSGDKINEWTVIEEKRNSENGKSLGFLCRCSCGTERIISPSKLKLNPSFSCGHTKEIVMEKGKRIGRLTVVGEGKRTSYGSRTISCKCDCGVIKDIPLTNLIKKKKTLSCGCLARELSSIRKSEYLSKPENRISVKYKWYFIDGKKKIKCRSSYEVFIWNYFKFILNEKIEYEKKIFTIDNETRYTPDFYLPKINTYLEPKGTFFLNEGSRKQMGIIKKLSKTEKILVLFWEDIYKMCELPFSSLTTYLEKAKKLKISPEKYLAERTYYEYRGGYDSKRKGKKELNIQ